MLLLLLSLQAQADCLEPVDSGSLVATLSAAESAFAGMQLDEFRASVDRAFAELPCLAEPLTPVDAAAVHRVDAYRAFLADDPEGTRAAFRAVRALTPAWRLPTSLATEDNPLRALFEEAVGDGGQTAAIAAPPDAAYLLVDGLRTLEHPTDRPAVVQVVDERGAIAWTGMLQDGVAAPDWVALGLAPAPVAELALDPPGPDVLAEAPMEQATTPRRHRATLPLAASAGVAALAAGGLYTVAAIGHAAYLDPDNPDIQTDAELDALRIRTNTAASLSVGFGVAAVGLGTLALFSTRW